MDSSSTSFFEFIAIGLLLVYLFGKLLGFRRRVRGKSEKRAFSSHKASKGNAQRLAPTERQIALVDAMRKEGLLSDLEKRMIPANQSRSFYSYLIDRHIEESTISWLLSMRKRQSIRKPRQRLIQAAIRGNGSISTISRRLTSSPSISAPGYSPKGSTPSTRCFTVLAASKGSRFARRCG